MGGELTSDWSVNLCDAFECYDGVPPNGVMSPIPEASAGYLKLIASSEGVAGYGTLHFWVFPQGQQELKQSLYFTFHTPGALTTPQYQDEDLGVHWGQDGVARLSWPSSAQPENAGWSLWSVTGSQLASGGVQPHCVWSGLPIGLYLLEQRWGAQRRTTRVLIP
jgi:hypothetical protein